MKTKINFRIPIIIILTIILIIMCYLYFKDNINSEFNNMQFDMMSNLENIQENEAISTGNTTIFSATSEVSSGLTEKLELHATYYLEKSYVKTNQLVKLGENILKYTNGKYLTAPYDLIITEINIPEEDAKCSNEHYITVSSNNTLKVQFRVDETKISNINLGQVAEIEISAYEDKMLEGIVTNISSTASNGKFTVTVEFENDGEVMIGMTSIVTIKK